MIHIILSILILLASAGVYIFLVSSFSPVMTLVLGLAVTYLILALNRSTDEASHQRVKYRKYHNLF